jgi:SAM-dependent methyltransferase
MNSDWPSAAIINDFSYSKLSHFDLFKNLPFQSYNVGDPNPGICDLKVYQDYLTYCFIRKNIPVGSRILEVGGGDSRILKFFFKEYECWNVDKCEGLGNGPIQFSSPHYKIVYDYIGAFNNQLPDSYFDLVFSISALEHAPEEQGWREAIARDINRVLKPGGLSFHCLDVVFRPDNSAWINGLIPYLYQTQPMLTRMANQKEVRENPGTFYMSQSAYDASWLPTVKVPYATYGRPLSYNFIWIKPVQLNHGQVAGTTAH